MFNKLSELESKADFEFLVIGLKKNISSTSIHIKDIQTGVNTIVGRQLRYVLMTESELSKISSDEMLWLLTRIRGNGVSTELSKVGILIKDKDDYRIVWM